MQADSLDTLLLHLFDILLCILSFDRQPPSLFNPTISVQLSLFNPTELHKKTAIPELKKNHYYPNLRLWDDEIIQLAMSHDYLSGDTVERRERSERMNQTTAPP